MEQQLIDKAIEYLEKSETFLLQECPEIIQQTLKYATWTTCLNVVFSSIIFLICICLFIYTYKNQGVDRHGSPDLITILTLFLSAFVPLPLFAHIFSEADRLMKIIIAPKLFLLQYFINLKN